MLILLLSAFLPVVTTQGVYKAVANRLLDTPLVSNLNSPLTYNYNPSMYVDDAGVYWLVVRSQNSTGGTYNVGPSVLALTQFTNANFTAVAPLTIGSVIIAPYSPGVDGCGDEDPRVTVQNSTLYLTYTAYTCAQPNLALATAPIGNATDPAAWTRHGTVFQNTKSAGILFRNGTTSDPHRMFYNAGTVQLATSLDGITWNSEPGSFLSPRPGMFDGALIEGGPHPLPLSDGNYFYLYNSDEPGPSTKKPDWSTRYNCGFAILNGTDPTHVLQRSQEPLFSPELPWEMDEDGLLTPNVVFCEGMVAKPGSTDTFVFVYGAGDSYVGVGEIRVTVPPPASVLSAARVTSALPAVSTANSANSYNYDASVYVAPPSSKGSLADGAAAGLNVLVRIRNITGSTIYDVGPSAVAVATLAPPYYNTTTAPVSGSPSLYPDGSSFETCGVEDARAVWSDVLGLYIVTYTAYDCTTARIMIATTPDPSNSTLWNRIGPAFDNVASVTWSKSGSILLMPLPPHYLFWGDNNDGQGLHVAVSFTDGTEWSTTDSILASTRSDGAGPSFDAGLVQVGSAPVQLSDGNYLMLYAGSVSNVPSPRPGWSGYYCVGYLILNGTDPSQVLQRSTPEAPLLCPYETWETGANATTAQYPDRISPNGLVPWPSSAASDAASTSSGTDVFLMTYGAADAFVGVAQVVVTPPSASSPSAAVYRVSVSGK